MSKSKMIRKHSIKEIQAALDEASSDKCIDCEHVSECTHHISTYCVCLIQEALNLLV